MRNPIAAEIFNEAICTLLKTKIRSTLRKSDEVTIAFDYEGEVTRKDSEAILESAQGLHSRVLEAVGRARAPERREALTLFAAGLSRTFYDFEPDFFQQNVSRIVDDEIGLIHATLEIWPTLLEIVYFRKNCRHLPLRRVKNKERNGRPTT
jgi:hypothetical protein